MKTSLESFELCLNDSFCRRHSCLELLENLAGLVKEVIVVGDRLGVLPQVGFVGDDPGAEVQFVLVLFFVVLGPGPHLSSS